MGLRRSGSKWARGIASSLVVGGIAAGAARAQEPQAFADRGAVDPSLEGAVSVPVVLEGFVLDAEGAPAEGAVVVTSAGGQAVVDENGSYRLEVPVPLDAQSLQVTAIGKEEGSALATTSVEIIPTSGRVTVRILSLAPRATCEPEWLPTFGGLPGTGGGINASVVYDDGGGPALYLGGSFSGVSNVPASGVAKWDGSSWAALGSGVSNILGSGFVRALAVYDDGGGPRLYAGGQISTAGGVAAPGIAAWDGSAWTPLGNGMNGSVFALAVYDDGSGAALYAGGFFTTAGGVAANRIAKWDGSSWTALGSGVSGGTNATVDALAVYDDGSGAALYAGGTFQHAPDSGDSYLAKWGVLDTSAPVIDCPSDVTVRGGPATPVSYSVGASDDCDPAPELVCVPPSGSVFGWGTTTVTCTAMDAANNVSLCTFDVTVLPRSQVHAGPPQPWPGSPAPWHEPTPLTQLHRGGELRTGSGENPLRLVSASAPRSGREWMALVDVASQRGARGSLLLLSDRALEAGSATSFGELLIDIGAPHLVATSVVQSSRGTHAHRWLLEPRAAMLGSELHAQALILGQELVLTNAVDLVVGR